jgi:hypothetical protein
VEKGVELRAGPGPDARLRGAFGGRTKVDVLRDENGWSLVRAPVVSGGAVEGWVLSSAVKSAEKEPARAKAEAAPTTPKAKAAEAPAPKQPAEKPPTEKQAAAEKQVPAATPMAARKEPPKAPASKGPDSIVLKPIPGTAGDKPPVPFPHKAHYTDDGVKCITCHHVVKARGNVEAPSHRCTDAGCHAAQQCNNQTVEEKNRACPFFQDAFHFNCIECHKQQSGPTKCKECHSG